MTSVGTSAPGAGGRHALSAASYGARGRRYRTSPNDSQAGGTDNTSTLTTNLSFKSSNRSSSSLNSTYSRILSQTRPIINSKNRTAKKERILGLGRSRFDHGSLHRQDVEDVRNPDITLETGKRKLHDDDDDGRIDDEHQFGKNGVKIMPQWIQDPLTTIMKPKRSRRTDWEPSPTSHLSPVAGVGIQDEIKRPDRLSLLYHSASSRGRISKDRFGSGGVRSEGEVGRITEGMPGLQMGIAKTSASLPLPIPFTISNDIRTSSIFSPSPYTQTQPNPTISQPRPYLIPPSPFFQPIRTRLQTPRMSTCPPFPFSTPGMLRSRPTRPLEPCSYESSGLDLYNRHPLTNGSSHHQLSNVAQDIMKQLETIDEEEDVIVRTSSEMSYMSLGEKGMVDMSLRSRIAEGGDGQGYQQDGQMREDGSFSPIEDVEHLSSSAENFWSSQHRRQEVQRIYYPTSSRSLNIDMLESAAQCNSQDMVRTCSSMSFSSTDSNVRERMTMDGMGMGQQGDMNREQQEMQAQGPIRSSERKSFRAPIQTFCPTPPPVPGVPGIPAPGPSQNDMDVDSIRSFEENVEMMMKNAPPDLMGQGNNSNASTSERVVSSISEGGSLSEDRTRVASSDHDAKMEDANLEKKELVVNHDVGFMIWQDG